MKKIIWIAVAIIVIAIVAVTVSKRNSNVDFGMVKLGVIAGTTGQYAPAGEAYLKGFSLALEQWNSSDAKPKFEAVFEDDGFDAKKGLTAYQKIKGIDGVAAYAVLSSFTIDAIYDLARADAKPIALGFEQSKPAEADNIFQVLPAARPVQLALGMKLKELGYKSPAAAVSNNTPVYQNFFSGFSEGYGEGVTKFEIGSDVAGIRSQALAIVAAKPDVVTFFMAPKDGALLVKEILKIAGDKKPYFAFDQSIQSGSTDYKTILGVDMKKLDGSIVSMSKNDLTDAFKNSYKQKYGAEPSFGADMGYNAFMTLADTYNGNLKTWIKNLSDARIKGADGELSFDSKGLRVPNVFFGNLKDGAVEVK